MKGYFAVEIIEDVRNGSGENSLNADNPVATEHQVPQHAYDGQSCPYIRFIKEIYSVLPSGIFKKLILAIPARISDLITGNNRNIGAEYFFIIGNRAFTGCIVNKYAIRKIHRFH